jgi:hypothetical protein
VRTSLEAELLAAGFGDHPRIPDRVPDDFDFSGFDAGQGFHLGLRVGGEKLQISTDTPKHIGVMMQGAILLFALGGEAFRRYKIRAVRMKAVAQ